MAEAKNPKSKGGRPKSANPVKPSISLKRSVEWRDWLNALAEHAGMPAALTINHALKAYAKAIGYEDPMPKR